MSVTVLDIGSTPERVNSFYHFLMKLQQYSLSSFKKCQGKAKAGLVTMQILHIIYSLQPQGPEQLVSSVLSSLSLLMQGCGFDTPLGRFFLVEGIFPLELTWVLTPFPQNSWMRVWTEVQSVHTRIPSHGLKRSWHSCPRRVNAGNKNTPACTIHEDEMWLPQWLD